jgi:hypothetical protein
MYGPVRPAVCGRSDRQSPRQTLFRRVSGFPTREAMFWDLFGFYPELHVEEGLRGQDQPLFKRQGQFKQCILSHNNQSIESFFSILCSTFHIALL